MNRRHVLATLGVTLSGGCLRLTGGGDESTPTRTTTRSATARPTDSPTQTDSPTATDTPTESATPTESPTPSPPSYPNGLSENGVRGSLFAFHTATLETTSFHTEWEKYDRKRNEFERRRQWDTERGQAVGQFLTRNAEFLGPAQVYRAIYTGSLWRENLASQYTYGQNPEGWDIEFTTYGDEIEPLVRDVNWGEPTRINDSRPAIWEVTAGSVVDGAEAPGYTTGTLLSLSGKMQISERGVIRSIEVGYQTREGTNDDRRQYTSTFSVSNIGNTTVSEPSWVAAARRNRPQISASITDDRRFVRLRINSGNRILPESVFFITNKNNSRVYAGRVAKPVTSEQTVYFFRKPQADGPRSLRIARGGRPTGVDPPTFDGDFRCAARRGTLRYFSQDNLG